MGSQAVPIGSELPLGEEFGAGTLCRQRFRQKHDGERVAKLAENERSRADAHVGDAAPRA